MLCHNKVENGFIMKFNIVCSTKILIPRIYTIWMYASVKSQF